MRLHVEVELENEMSVDLTSDELGQLAFFLEKQLTEYSLRDLDDNRYDFTSVVTRVLEQGFMADVTVEQ